MSDSSDNVLNVLIKLGVLGQADAQAAKQLLAETAVAAEQLKSKMAESADALSHYQSQNEGVSDAEAKTTDQARKAVSAHLDLRSIFDGLNEILPGFGDHLNGLAQGHQESTAAATAGVAANESFLASLRPLAALILTLQTAAEHWDKYKDRVQSAQETHSAALKQMETSLRSTLQAQSEFNLAVNGGDGKNQVKKNPQPTDQSGNLREGSDTASPRVPRTDNNAADLLGHITAGAGKTNQSQADAISQLRNAFAVINGNTDNLLAAIKHGLDHQLSVQQEVQLVKRQLAALAAKSSQGSYNNQ